jgi:thiamine transporter
MHPVQGFLDYIVAYTVVGLAGLVFKYVEREQIRKKNLKTTGMILLGILLGSALRFIAHFIAGMVFFGSGVADGQSVVVFSLLYNLSYMMPSVVVSGFIMMLLFAAAPRVILRKPAHHS